MLKWSISAVLFAAFVASATAQESKDFTDEFQGADLNPAFRVINPDKQYMALVGDALLLVTHADYKNVVEYNGALPDDYVVTIHVSEPPKYYGQNFFVRVGDSDDNVMVGVSKHQYDLNFFSDKILNGEDAKGIAVERDDMLGKPFYMKVEKIGPVYQGSFSPDGSKWTDLGKQVFVAPNAKISLVTGNWAEAPETPVQIEYFELRELLR